MKKIIFIALACMAISFTFCDMGSTKEDNVKKDSTIVVADTLSTDSINVDSVAVDSIKG